MTTTNPSTAHTSTLYLLRHGQIATPGILAGHTDVALSDLGWQQLNKAVAGIAGLANSSVNVINTSTNASTNTSTNSSANTLVNNVDKPINGLQVISSPLQRCQAFAQQLCREHNLALTVEPRIKEMNFGQWDGKTYKALWSAPESADLIGAFWQDPWQVTPPKGEPIDEFVARVDDWWQALVMQLKQEGEYRLEQQQRAELEIALANQPSNTKASSDIKNSTLVISHAGVIKLLIARILNMPIPGTNHMTCLDVPYAGVIKVEIFHDAEKSWPRILF